MPAIGAASRRGRKTWRAYLSTQAADGKPAVNARDRIGNGPWQNFKDEVVAQNADDLHTDNNKLGVNTSLAERGQIIPGVGFAPNRHDVLTGSTPEGRAFPAGEDRTCRNWTSGTQGAAMVGHIDRKGLRDDVASRSWNSSHPSRGSDGGCSQTICAALAATAILLLRRPVRRFYKLCEGGRAYNARPRLFGGLRLSSSNVFPCRKLRCVTRTIARGSAMSACGTELPIQAVRATVAIE